MNEKFNKSEIINKILEIKKIKRFLDDLAGEFNIKNHETNSIYVALIVYEKTLASVLDNIKE